MDKEIAFTEVNVRFGCLNVGVKNTSFLPLEGRLILSLKSYGSEPNLLYVV